MLSGPPFALFLASWPHPPAGVVATERDDSSTRHIEGQERMSERHKPHAGRDRSGHRKVRVVDVDDLLTDGPEGTEYLRDDVRMGGAVEDVGADAGQSAAAIGEMIADNRDDVSRAARPGSGRGGRSARRGGGKGAGRDDRGMR